MNRAFVKEDAPDGQVFIPPRAPLPEGAVNYVTPRGMALLKQEMAELEAERARIEKDQSDEAERTRGLNIVRGRAQDLRARIAGARVVHPHKQPQDEVRFGASVTLRSSAGTADRHDRTFQIVGVDEASATEGRIAFTAPIARAITGKRVGDRVPFQSAHGTEIIEIVAIAYVSNPDRD